MNYSLINLLLHDAKNPGQSSEKTAICSLQIEMGQKEKVILKNCFVYSNFNHCPLVYLTLIIVHLSEIFVLKSWCEKLGKFRRDVRE